SLMVGGLLAAAVLGYSLASYREVRASAVRAATARLASVASEWSRLLGNAATAQTARLGTASQSPAIRELVARPDASRAVEARRILAPLLPTNGRSRFDVLASDSRVLVQV